MTKQNQNSESGFSFVELLTTLAIMGILVGLIIPNYSMLKQQASDSATVSDYRNIKTAVLAGTSDPELELNYILFNFNGPGNLPGAMSSANLSKGSQLNYLLILSVTTPLTRTSWSLFEVQNDGGSFRYRYWDINGTVTEQRIAL